MSSQETWNTVDAYFAEQLVKSDSVLDAVLAESDRAGLPAIAVSPTQGKLLYLYAKMIGAKRVLEVGTLGAYSTIWMARALPQDGKVITLEYEPKHAEVARANIARAGFENLIDVRVGAALETLPKLEAEKQAPFDFVFIDADKANNANYLKWALKFSHPGTVIVGDNVVRGGRVAESSNSDPGVQGTRKLIELMSQEPRLDATAIQTVGIKGYDGFALARVR